MTATQRYFGKYRGTVISNLDPLMLGRLIVLVPDVLGPSPSGWANPCFPAAGVQAGVWAVPHVGAGVWVEFEQGDPDYPIWAGCWFGSAAEVPALAKAAPPGAPSIILQTLGQNTIMISDTPGAAGGILLKTRTGAMISISETGIIISNGQGATIALAGPTVSINQTALTVT